MMLILNILGIIYILPHQNIFKGMEISIWGPLLAAVAGSFITAILYRSLTEAKVKSIIATTYDQLVKTLTGEVTSLREEVERLRKRLDLLSQKELQYLTTITELTKERNNLQLIISEKDSRIIALENQMVELQRRIK